MDTKSVLRGELIGCNILIGDKKETARIIDETKNMLIVETKEGKKKKLMKKNL